MADLFSQEEYKLIMQTLMRSLKSLSTMIENNNITIVVSVYPEKFNYNEKDKEVSMAKAQAIVDYMVHKKGVDKNKIIAKACDYSNCEYKEGKSLIEFKIDEIDERQGLSKTTTIYFPRYIFRMKEK